MLIAFWILLVLYVGLTLVYAATNTKTSEISPWPLLTLDLKEKLIDTACQSNSDCPSTHICMLNQCIPKLLRVSHCDPKTGEWISYTYQGATFAVCVCKKPHLINQKYFGGNCDVNVGCGIHGKYLPDTNTCACDPGYKVVNLTCQKLPAIDYINLNPCQPGEIKVSSIKPSDGFHPDYVKRLSSLKCVKRPCTFDALSERPLKQAKYVDGWGCVCDPRYGLFGVVLEDGHLNNTDTKYLKTPGFDACASIFPEDPQDPIDVKLITYFYLGTREPVSFILYEGLKDHELANPFKESESILLGQKLWRYDYAQHFFDTQPQFRARTRKIYSFYLFDIETVYEWLYVNDFSPAPCEEVPNFWHNRLNRRVDIYSLLYTSPVCRIAQNDPKADPMFWGKVVVNPQHLTFKEHDHLHRFNAFVLKYDSNVGVNRWTLDLDYEYKPNTYMAIETNVPNYEVDMQKKPSIPELMNEGQN